MLEAHLLIQRRFVSGIKTKGIIILFIFQPSYGAQRACRLGDERVPAERRRWQHHQWKVHVSPHNFSSELFQTASSL